MLYSITSCTLKKKLHPVNPFIRKGVEMFYVIFVLAVVMTLLYLTDPFFLRRRKFKGQDLFEVMSERLEEKPVALILGVLYSIIHSLIYTPTVYIALPLVILYALSNEIGLRVVSLIAAGVIVFMVLRIGHTIWQLFLEKKGKATIQTSDGERYEGELISEVTVTTVDVRIQDLNPDVPYASGILLDEATEFIQVVTADGIKTIKKEHPFGSLDIKKKKRSEAKIRLKDGTEKTGRRVVIVGETPVKDFLGDLPRLSLIIYLWYLVYVFVA